MIFINIYLSKKFSNNFSPDMQLVHILSGRDLLKIYKENYF